MDNPDEKKSYAQIFESAVMVGGSQVINILFGIVRSKFSAVLLGPTGVGLIGIYNAITSMVSSISGLGIGSSGVREVAEAVSTGDNVKISRTIITLKRLSLFLGLMGTLFIVLLRSPLSRLSFGNESYSTNIVIISVTVCFGGISAGQLALLQGFRRIADLARISVIGSFLATTCGIPILFFYRQNGIAPYLMVVSTVSILSSWWYARKVRLTKIRMTRRETLAEGRGLISLGLAFMASAVMASSVAYLIRVILTHRFGLDNVGLYQAAFTISSLYIGIILNAMGMDYYPRLTAIASNNKACNELVNQQTEAGLLLAAPGIIATLIFAPFVIRIFYSASFVPAYGILRWSILGVFLRVISWPIGYVLLAKAKSTTFFFAELAANLVLLVFTWAGIRVFGLAGAGIAFFGLYIFYTAMILLIVNRLSGFFWTRRNLQLCGIIGCSIIAATIISNFASGKITIISGSFLTMAVTAYSIWKLYERIGLGWLAAYINKRRMKRP